MNKIKSFCKGNKPFVVIATVFVLFGIIFNNKLVTLSDNLTNQAAQIVSLARNSTPVIIITDPKPPVGAPNVPSTISSSYLFIPTIKENLLPYSGTGIDTLADSCSSYPKIINDVLKITSLLDSHIKKAVYRYNANSCNTQPTLSKACVQYLDTINNLALTYTIYKIEGLKSTKDKTTTCNVDSTNIPDTDSKDYSSIDLTAIAYDSVKFAYFGANFTDASTLISRINKISTIRFNSAYLNNKYVSIQTSEKKLRELAQMTFQSQNLVVAPKPSSIPPSMTLDNSSPFFFFGLTDNIDHTGQLSVNLPFEKRKTITSITFGSLQEYDTVFNQNYTTFSDLYNPRVNISLLEKSVSELTKLQTLINLAIDPMIDKNPVLMTENTNNSSLRDAILEVVEGGLYSKKAVAAITTNKASGTGKAVEVSCVARKKYSALAQKELSKTTLWQKIKDGKISRNAAIVKELNRTGITDQEKKQNIKDTIDIAKCPLHFFAYWEF